MCISCVVVVFWCEDVDAVVLHQFITDGAMMKKNSVLSLTGIASVRYLII